MNWEEKIRSSDAGRGSREIAERMIREVGEEVPGTEPSWHPSDLPETVVPDHQGNS